MPAPCEENHCSLPAFRNGLCKDHYYISTILRKMDEGGGRCYDSCHRPTCRTECCCVSKNRRRYRRRRRRSPSTTSSSSSSSSSSPISFSSSSSDEEFDSMVRLSVARKGSSSAVGGNERNYDEDEENVGPYALTPYMAAPQSAAPQSAAPQSAAPQWAAPQSAAAQWAASQLAAPQWAAPQSAAPQWAASHMDASHMDASHMDALHMATARSAGVHSTGSRAQSRPGNSATSAPFSFTGIPVSQANTRFSWEEQAKNSFPLRTIPEGNKEHGQPSTANSLQSGTTSRSGTRRRHTFFLGGQGTSEI